MAQAVNRVLDLRRHRHRRRRPRGLRLPPGGLMMRGSLADTVAREDALRAALELRGHPFHDPVFSLFFMAADFLPSVRLTPRGVWDVKRARVLLPSRRR
jgi:adenine deaminase